MKKIQNKIKTFFSINARRSGDIPTMFATLYSLAPEEVPDTEIKTAVDLYLFPNMSIMAMID